MSWDIWIAKLSRVYESPSDIPENEKPLSIGTRQAIHDAVSAVFPRTNWNDPAWGIWDSDFGSIEFNVGKNDPVSSMTLHVRAGQQIVPSIVLLCRENGWQGLDFSSGNFIERSGNPGEGLVSWTKYRDQVVGGKAKK